MKFKYIINIVVLIFKQKLKLSEVYSVIEILVMIKNKEKSTFKKISNMNSYSEVSGGDEILIELLNSLENIINISPSLKSESVDNRFSELANLLKLAGMLDEVTDARIKYLLKNFTSEVLNADYVSSQGFSQEGEDLVLKRLFPVDKIGFFVDVGAHHPTRFSNTYLLYKKGWRGINIDPRPGMKEIFDSMRPKDINLEVAVGSDQKRQDTINYVSFEEPAYNSVFYEGEEQGENIEKSNVVEIRKVPIKTLDSILEEYSSLFDKIDMLSIDVEGFELQVLSGFSIEKYKPAIIVLELRGFDLDARLATKEYEFIVNSGYKLRSILFHSLIFEIQTS